MTVWIPTFKKLRDAWYDCLADEGFVDHESITNGDDSKLKRTKGAKKVTAVSVIVSEDYYKTLSEKIQTAVFKNDIHRFIMQRHAEGNGTTSIMRALAEQGIHRCRNSIMFTIRRYEFCWGLRVYSAKQLNDQVIRDYSKYRKPA